MIDEIQNSNAHVLYSTFWQNRGPINPNHFEDYFERLLVNTDGHVRFDWSKKESSIFNGVCSAQCLSFLAIYLRSFVHEPVVLLRNNEPLYKDFEDRLIKCLNSCPNDTEIRTYQAALNTISRTYASHLFPPGSGEFMEMKIRALCALKALKVTDVSPNTIDFIENTDAQNKENMDHILDNLSNGSYLIRAICETDNDKGEYYGHSMALIKTDQKTYFFDPSSLGGLVSIEHHCEREYLYDFLKSLCLSYRLNYPRFYKVKTSDTRLVPNFAEKLLLKRESDH